MSTPRLLPFVGILALSCLTSYAGIKPRNITRQGTRASVVMERCDNRQPLTVGKHSTAPLTSMGSPLVPVILVQFADTAFSCADTPEGVNDFYDKFMNGNGIDPYYTGAGSYGAVSEYFRDQSYGQFTPIFVPLGPITLSKSYAYYGKNSGSSKDVNIGEFYSESISLAQSQIETQDWSYFDNDSNGVVDMVFFIYAGRGENDSKSRNSNLIWPKENGGGGIINGIRYGAYACCNEIYNGKTDGIGVMCHELSHALGLPDLYDYGYEAYGMDYWDLMDSGCYCANGYRPSGYSAYQKAFMGWRDLIEIEPGEGMDITLYPINRDNGYAYKVVNPENRNEYYILENRNNEGWDYNLGYSTTSLGLFHGLLVTHIDYVESRWTSNNINGNVNHQYYTIIPADGDLCSSMFANQEYSIQDYIKSMGGDIFPGTAYTREDIQKTFSPVDSLTGARAHVYTSTGPTPHQMNQPITNITLNPDASLSFRINGGDPTSISPTPYTKGNESDSNYYDLLGRPHSPSAVLNPGIYLHQGKKIIIR